METIRKDILHPKTNKKPQQNCRRGILEIQSIPIPPRWVTHKLENNYITEILPQESSKPHVRLPSLEVQHEEEPPEYFGFEGQQGLTTGAPQDWGNRLHFCRAQHKVSHTRTQGQSSDIVGALARPILMGLLRR